jgi:putative endonuclease
MEMKTDKRVFGDAGENLAVKYLENKNYKILKRNYVCPLGEIDVIARRENDLVFVEVKTRSTAAFGGALLAVTELKRRKTARAAISYIKRFKPKYDNIIFDIIAITDGEIEHIENAFTPRGFTV